VESLQYVFHLADWPGTVLFKFCLKSFPGNSLSIWTTEPKPT